MSRAGSPRRCTHAETNLRGAVTLQRGCYYEQKFTIETPDTVLDCDGAELRTPEDYAVNIKKEADRAVVKNCYVVGSRGIAVRTRNRTRNGETPNDLRALAAADVVLENLHISNTVHVGVHLLPHTVGVTIRNSVLTGNSSSGIYMSPYGKRHRVLNNEISNNGHIKPDGRRRIGWFRREGIAIDASSEHVIENNDITRNALGGILLYKNCWEHAADEPDSQPRTEHASSNIIRNNRFGDQPFGVWVASRQSRDLRSLECGDPTPYSNPININSVFHPTYSSYPSAYTSDYIFSLNRVWAWPDFAEDNVITGNVFALHSRGGIRVEDDETEVTRNLFVGDYDYIFVGAPFRARLAMQPVTDTNIADNSYHSPQGTNFRGRLALIPDEHRGTILRDNYRACDDTNGNYIRHDDTITVPAPPNAPAGCPNYVRVCRDGTLASPVPHPDCAMSPPDAGTSVDAQPDAAEPNDAMALDASDTVGHDARSPTDSGRRRPGMTMPDAGGRTDMSVDAGDEPADSSAAAEPPSTTPPSSCATRSPQSPSWLLIGFGLVVWRWRRSRRAHA